MSISPRLLVLLTSVIAAVATVCVALLTSTTYDTRVAIKSMDCMQRQPEARNPLMVTMLMSIGLIESLPVIAAVIAIALVFANPFVELF